MWRRKGPEIAPDSPMRKWTPEESQMALNEEVPANSSHLGTATEPLIESGYVPVSVFGDGIAENNLSPEEIRALYRAQVKPPNGNNLSALVGEVRQVIEITADDILPSDDRRPLILNASMSQPMRTNTVVLGRGGEDERPVISNDSGRAAAAAAMSHVESQPETVLSGGAILDPEYFIADEIVTEATRCLHAYPKEKLSLEDLHKEGCRRFEKLLKKQGVYLFPPERFDALESKIAQLANEQQLRLEGLKKNIKEQERTAKKKAAEKAENIAAGKKGNWDWVKYPTHALNATIIVMSLMALRPNETNSIIHQAGRVFNPPITSSDMVFTGGAAMRNVEIRGETAIVTAEEPETATAFTPLETETSTIETSEPQNVYEAAEVARAQTRGPSAAEDDSAVTAALNLSQTQNPGPRVSRDNVELPANDRLLGGSENKPEEIDGWFPYDGNGSVEEWYQEVTERQVEARKTKQTAGAA